MDNSSICFNFRIFCTGDTSKRNYHMFYGSRASLPSKLPRGPQPCGAEIRVCPNQVFALIAGAHILFRRCQRARIFAFGAHSSRRFPFFPLASCSSSQPAKKRIRRERRFSARSLPGALSPRIYLLFRYSSFRTLPFIVLWFGRVYRQLGIRRTFSFSIF